MSLLSLMKQEGCTNYKISDVKIMDTHEYTFSSNNEADNLKNQYEVYHLGQVHPNRTLGTTRALQPK
jgi:hypothetical protein